MMMKIRMLAICSRSLFQLDAVEFVLRSSTVSSRLILFLETFKRNPILTKKEGKCLLLFKCCPNLQSPNLFKAIFPVVEFAPRLPMQIHNIRICFPILLTSPTMLASTNESIFVVRKAKSKLFARFCRVAKRRRPASQCKSRHRLSCRRTSLGLGQVRCLSHVYGGSSRNPNRLGK